MHLSARKYDYVSGQRKKNSLKLSARKCDYGSGQRENPLYQLGCVRTEANPTNQLGSTISATML